MNVIFLAPDKHTLVSKPVAHVYTTEIEDDSDGCVYYECLYFYLDQGLLTLATSPGAAKHVGEFLGVLADGEDPELLRASADELLLDMLTAELPHGDMQ